MSIEIIAVNPDGSPAVADNGYSMYPDLVVEHGAESSLANYPNVADRWARQERYRQQTGNAGHLMPTGTAPFAGKAARIYSEHLLQQLTPDEWERLEALNETRNMWARASEDFDIRAPCFELPNRPAYPTMPLPVRTTLWSRYPTPSEQQQ